MLHELAHMWFGDLVTMTWWDDLWLNESFAEWASHWAQVVATTKYSDAWTTFCNARKNWAYRQDQLPSTHPIAADMVDFHAVEVNFDGITYAKGASTLRQLVAFVGEDTFVTALKEYFADHAFGNTELTDLLKPLEKASGRDLDDWTERWLRTAGVNTLRADFAVDAAGAFTSFAIEQTADGQRSRSCGRTGSRSACTGVPTRAWSGPSGSRSTSTARGPSSPSWSARPSRIWYC